MSVSLAGIDSSLARSSTERICPPTLMTPSSSGGPDGTGVHFGQGRTCTRSANSRAYRSAPSVKTSTRTAAPGASVVVPRAADSSRAPVHLLNSLR